MKQFKKLTALFLVLILAFSSVIGVNAVSMDDGIEQLKRQFV